MHENVPRTDVAAGIVDLQRVWGDASHFEPEMASRMGLRWYKNRVAFSYYPDGKSLYVKGTKESLPAHKRRTFLILIGMLSGRLELGTSFGSMTPEMLHDICRLYPMINRPKSPRPVDMLMGKKHPEVYVYDVTDQWLQVILCNNSKEDRQLQTPFSGDQCETGSLGLAADKEYYVYDFWNNRFIGRFKGSEKLECHLRGEEALMFSVNTALGRPQFISTNRHIMQGMMELSDVKWNPATSSYSGTADVIGGEPMEIVIACNGYRNPKVTVSAGESKLKQLDNDLILLQIVCEKNMKVQWKLVF